MFVQGVVRGAGRGSWVARPVGNSTSEGLGRCRPLAYTGTMEFEWDDAKSNACYAERGFDFGYVVQVFLDADRMVEIDDRFDYGETRYRVLGRIEGRLYAVIYTLRGPLVRLISARKANRREVRRYEQSTRKTESGRHPAIGP